MNKVMNGGSGDRNISWADMYANWFDGPTTNSSRRITLCSTLRGGAECLLSPASSFLTSLLTIHSPILLEGICLTTENPISISLSNEAFKISLITDEKCFLSQMAVYELGTPMVQHSPSTERR